MKHKTAWIASLFLANVATVLANEDGSGENASGEGGSGDSPSSQAPMNTAVIVSLIVIGVAIVSGIAFWTYRKFAPSRDKANNGFPPVNSLNQIGAAVRGGTLPMIPIPVNNNDHV